MAQTQESPRTRAVGNQQDKETKPANAARVGDKTRMEPRPDAHNFSQAATKIKEEEKRMRLESENPVRRTRGNQKALAECSTEQNTSQRVAVRKVASDSGAPISPIDDVLARLDWKKSGKEYSALCPAHDDTKPSLSVTATSDGTVLLKCHAGCKTQAIVEKMGLTLRDLFPRKVKAARKPQSSRIVATYPYEDEGGKLLYEIVRFDPKDFRPRRRDGKGHWVWNLKGTRRVPYHLPDLATADLVLILEGEKDTDTAREMGLTATCNTGGAGKWRPEYAEPLRGKHVVILPHKDEAGEKHALQVARSLFLIAASVKIVRLPGLPEKGDLWDWRDAGHTKAELLALIEAAQVWTQDDQDRATQEDENEASGLRVIVTNNRPLREISDESLAALLAKNDPPSLFVRSGRLTRRVYDEEQHPIFDRLTESALCGFLTRSADFVTRTRTKENEIVDTQVSPPMPLVRDVYSLGSWPFPPLAGLTECPVLRPDGTIVTEAGYDAATRLLYEPARGLSVPLLPSSPTQTDAHIAAHFILSELLPDFPFCGEADKANMLAALLTPIVRPAILGNIPLCLLDKPAPGTGASLLSDLMSIVATGEHAAMLSAPTGRDSEAEWGKRLTAILLKGSPVVVIDNIDHTLRSSELAKVLTAKRHEDRILGKSEMVSLPVRVCFIATANNISVRGDLARRSYRIRIDAKTERPWTRTGFKHNDLLQWTRDHRGELLAALLTLARAWFVATQPKGTVPTIGGFTEWAKTLGGILAYADVPGFLNNLDELYALVDDEGPAWGAFFTALHAHFREEWFTVAQIGEAGSSPMYAAIPDSVGWDESKAASSKLRLGKAFQKRMDRIFSGLRLERNQEKDAIHNTAQWRVRRIGEA